MNNPSNKKLETSINPPTNFSEFMKLKSVFKLLSNYACENFGEDYVTCFNYLMKYKRTKSPELMKKLESFIKLNSPNLCVLNPSVRSEIYHSGVFQEDWEDKLFNFIFDVLENEYYPRFIFSKTWKDFLKSNFKMNERKFDESYEIVSINKKTNSFSQKIEYCSVVNKLTQELFSAKRIICTKEESKQESLQCLNQIQHENLIQLIELFVEDSQEFDNITCLTIVTTSSKENLNSFYKILEEPLTNEEVVKFMIQLSLAIQQLQSKSRYFDIGKLIEENIYVTKFYTTIILDSGFYYENNDHSNYFNPPENFASKKSDIYALGFIFYRMVTLDSPDKIEKLFALNLELKSKKGLVGSLIDKIKLTPEYQINAKDQLKKKVFPYSIIYKDSLF
jgi:serine/threonine protein kinase